MNLRMCITALMLMLPATVFGQVPEGNTWDLCYTVTHDCTNTSTRISKVKDGDTVQLDTTWLPEVLNDNFSLRVVGIDTPEKDWRAECDLENEMGHKATTFTSDALLKANVITVNIKGWDKFGGRVDGELVLDGVKLSDMLLDHGLAKPFTGKEKKKSWCK